MEYLFIYLLQMVDVVYNVSRFVTFLLILLMVFYVLALIVKSAMVAEGSEPKEIESADKVCGNTLKYIVIAIVTSAILWAIPTKQTLLLMGGTYLGKKTITTVVDSGKLEKINTIIDLQLDKYIDELKAGE